MTTQNIQIRSYQGIHLADLNEALREAKRPADGKISKLISLPTLKDIESAARFKAFINKPKVKVMTGIVMVLLAGGLAYASLALFTVAATSLVVTAAKALLVLGQVFTLSGVVLFISGLWDSMSGFPHSLSKAYENQAEEARRLRGELHSTTDPADIVVE